MLQMILVSSRLQIPGRLKLYFTHLCFHQSTKHGILVITVIQYLLVNMRQRYKISLNHSSIDYRCLFQVYRIFWKSRKGRVATRFKHLVDVRITVAKQLKVNSRRQKDYTRSNSRKQRAN